MAIVILRYWAAAKEAAGTAEEKVSAQTLAEALEAAISRQASPPPAERASRLRDVLARSSFLINGNPAGTRPRAAITLADGDLVEVLPPFAGG